MTPEEHELLVDLNRVCDQAPLFILEFATGDLPVEAEQAYAFWQSQLPMPRPEQR
jgi:hypothetical protein